MRINAKKLDDAILKSGLIYKELRALSHLSRQTIWRARYGLYKRPRANTVYRLAEALKVDVNDLLED